MHEIHAWLQAIHFVCSLFDQHEMVHKVFCLFSWLFLCACPETNYNSWSQTGDEIAFCLPCKLFSKNRNLANSPANRRERKGTWSEMKAVEEMEDGEADELWNNWFDTISMHMASTRSSRSPPNPIEEKEVKKNTERNCRVQQRQREAYIQIIIWISINGNLSLEVAARWRVSTVFIVCEQWTLPLSLCPIICRALNRCKLYIAKITNDLVCMNGW